MPRAAAMLAPRMPASVVEAALTLRYSGRAEVSDDAQLHLQALLDILKQRLGVLLACEPGHDFALSVGGALSDLPYDSFFIALSLSAAAAHADTLFAVMLREIECLKQNGVDAEELSMARRQRLDSRRVTLRGQGASGLGDYASRVAAIAAEDVRLAACRYFMMENRQQLIHGGAPRVYAVAELA